MTPEGKVKKEIKTYLDSIGAYYFMPVPMGYGKRTVDFLVCWRGAFIAIEAKRRKGRAKAFQERILLDIQNAGGETRIITDSEELQQFKEWCTCVV